MDVDLFDESTMDYINAQQQNYDLSQYTSKTKKRFKPIHFKSPNVEHLMKNFEVTQTQNYFDTSVIQSPKPNNDLFSNPRSHEDFSDLCERVLN